LAEANHLARQGTREINLIAQDVTQFGYDLYRQFTLPKLLRELDKVEGIDWVRILYFYPNRLTDEVIEAMRDCVSVVPYIDIPLQHAHPDTLRRMRRPWEGERYLKLFEKVRAAMPEVAIRTTFIVGFPGETDAEFQYLLDFVREARLDRVGAFLFSREPGTPSFDMGDQISSKIKQERYDKLMRTQQRISLEVNQHWVGRKLSVLTEDRRGDWWIGRSHRDAPEIDGLVFFQGDSALGQIAEVEVQKAEPYDLYGQTVGFMRQTRNPLRPLRQAIPIAPQ
jgi:ribosomal protein S12 methylthiotransferase